LTKSYRVFINIVEQLDVLNPGDRYRVRTKYGKFLTTLNSILDIKREITGTGDSLLKNTSVDMRLRHNPYLGRIVYSYIIAHVLEPKDEK
jgi:hypothetical protein